jgi:hypothetical protein
MLWYKRHARLSRFFLIWLDWRSLRWNVKLWCSLENIINRIDGRSLTQTNKFKYLGVFFDSGLRWSTQVRYVKRRCLRRWNFLRSMAGTMWGAHLRLCYFYKKDQFWIMRLYVILGWLECTFWSKKDIRVQGLLEISHILWYA